MKGLILAAGKGTRLYPITQRIAKPLMPLANRITLAYAFDRLLELGVDEIGLVVGENEGQMRDALGDGRDYGVQLTFIRQPEPKGLAHAVSFAREFVAGDDFVLYLGDAIYSDSLVPFRSRFLDSGCANLNLVKPVEDPSRFGVANVDGERIVRLVEKPPVPESNLAMAGLYFFGPSIWDVLPDLQPSGRGEYEITDAIQMLIDRGETVLAGVYEGRWFDTGTLDSFLDSTAFLVEGGTRIDPSAQVTGSVGSRVVIGLGARVVCRSIEDATILPGAQVTVEGRIEHSILAGTVASETDLIGQIIDG
ncbi:MAG TPA: sugar phosphate nucleotidyltransferase [Fimbriimonadaceae bacterium]|nr:sugar phosphate nucleotidyltransferase [Fimbriimonadaceae bacterium]